MSLWLGRTQPEGSGLGDKTHHGFPPNCSACTSPRPQPLTAWVGLVSGIPMGTAGFGEEILEAGVGCGWAAEKPF